MRMDTVWGRCVRRFADRLCSQWPAMINTRRLPQRGFHSHHMQIAIFHVTPSPLLLIQSAVKGVCSAETKRLLTLIAYRLETKRLLTLIAYRLETKRLLTSIAYRLETKRLLSLIAYRLKTKSLHFTFQWFQKASTFEQKNKQT